MPIATRTHANGKMASLYIVNDERFNYYPIVEVSVYDWRDHGAGVKVVVEPRVEGVKVEVVDLAEVLADDERQRREAANA
jgi:hypothetical protein